MLPAFEWCDLHSAINGCLNNVSNREFGSPELAQLFYQNSGMIDRRVCHMSRPNHTVLADKIHRSFVDPQRPIVDFGTGFHTNLYTTQQQVEEFKVSL